MFYELSDKRGKPDNQKQMFYKLSDNREESDNQRATVLELDP
ncbi:hypothetical protein C8U37_11754 [Trichococcus patagoniensis]|uniref:Uncharacterized protein n=1 Tax=Trichococcus patagoniensis TaxID=382641 RepID=A0A2T5IF63_9LACT|nr:hypothetical protein C8U37_11754 [Trichococcus patagoniensis]